MQESPFMNFLFYGALYVSDGHRREGLTGFNLQQVQHSFLLALSTVLLLHLH